MRADQSLRLHLVLPVRNQKALDKFVKDVTNPASPLFRQYLTPQQFTERFGPTEADYKKLEEFANSQGFHIVGGSRDGMDLQIEGSVSLIEAAFNVTMGRYRHPKENREFFAADREPTVDLPFRLWHVSGLDNNSNPYPKVAKKEAFAKARGMSADSVVSHATTGSGPSSSFLGSDMRAAYYGGTALTGAGQNLGLLEFAGTNLADVTTYYTNAKQTNTVPITLLSVDGTSTACVAPKCDDTEPTLDITQALGMAPGLASLVVYVGSSDTAMISAMTTHNPLPTTIGCSWGWTPADPGVLDPYFQKMAAQGQTFFAASGDASTWSSKNEAWPADDPYVVSVGGTDLVTSGAAGAWGSETAWVNSGGGVSPDNIAIPAWQKLAGVINSTNKGSTTLRNGPDVSANANFTFYVCANQTTCSANSYGGTSFAAPMWAGYIALANQQAVASGKPLLGYINPALYSLGTGTGYAADFHDVTSGISGSYSATSGYDLVTGWGSPNGTGLINALLNVPAPAGFSLSGTAVSVVQGSNGTSTISTSVTGGFNSAIALSVSGLPSGVTASFNPASVTGAGTSTLTFTTAATTAAGNYSITVTGTSGTTSHTATVTLTVTGAPGFTISASPTTVSVAPGGKGTSTVATAVTGGFSSAVTLTATGLPTGVTAAFSPTSITGAGSSTLTLTVASTAAVGNYPITVTGTSGSITHTATVTLTVPSGASGFSLSAAPTTVTVAPSATGTSTITTAVTGGFNSAIALTATGLPAGVTAAFSPASITGAGTSKLTFTATSAAAAGNYTVTVTGTSGTTSHTATVTLTIATPPAFTISASPAVLSVQQGSKGTSTITVGVSAGFSSTIQLSLAGIPSGVTPSFGSVTSPSAGIYTLTLTLSAGSNAAAATSNISVNATSGSTTHTATIALTVTAAPAFAVSASPATVTVARGAKGTATFTTTVTGGFNSAIAVAASGLPSGVTATFSPASITGAGNSTVTFTVASTAKTGTYPINLTGTSGSTAHSASVNLVVTN
jgi:kumamolisin